MSSPKAKIANNSQPEISRESFDTIAQLFKAFADPNRLMLIQSLRFSPKNVGQLVTEIGLSQANVSKHLQILFEAKILSREKRGTSTYYSIYDEIVYPLCDLVCSKINKDYGDQKPVEFILSPDYSI
jgi:DNA-binding transcriptional ArsR family regulator